MEGKDRVGCQEGGDASNPVLTEGLLGVEYKRVEWWCDSCAYEDELDYRF